MVVDTGSFVKDIKQQDLIKFDISMQALSLLGYDLVNLDSRDWQISQNVGVLFDQILDFISSYSSDGENSDRSIKEFTVNDRKIVINVAAFDPRDNEIERIYDLFDSEKQNIPINILILNHCGEETIDQISEMNVVDCVICPPEFDEPALFGRSDKKPLVVSSGRFSI